MFFEKIGNVIKPRKFGVYAGAMLVAIALTAPNTAFADEYASKQAEAEAALQSLNTMMIRLDEANENYNKALKEQEEAEKKVKEAQETIDKKTDEIKEYQSQLSTRARSMYRADSASFIDVLLNSATFDEFATNVDILNDLNENDAKTISNAKAAREELWEAKAVLEEESKRAKEKTDEAAALRHEANKMAMDMQEVYSQLSDEALAVIASQNVTETNATQVSQDKIVSFDEITGNVTLADGTVAKVVGYDSNTGNAIVDLAMSFVGGNYQWGASDAANSTFDCSGLVQYVYAQNGIAVGGHNDRAILNAGTVVDSPQAGDICWWDGHVAIYAGNGMMVSADNEQYGITYREVSDGATYVRY